MHLRIAFYAAGTVSGAILGLGSDSWGEVIIKLLFVNILFGVLIWASMRRRSRSSNQL